MELLALILIGPPVLLAVAGVCLLLKRFKRLPARINPWVFGALLWTIATGGLIAIDRIHELVARPWRLQLAHLGKQYGTPLDLRAYSADGFQDVLFQWSFQLTPAQVTELRGRCGEVTEAWGHKGCVLYSWHGGEYDDESRLLLLSGDHLYIAETA
jgi:hypothetical protein